MEFFYKLIFFILLILTYNLKADVYTLKWNEVKKNHGYLIQVKNIDDKIIINRQVNKNEINFDIPKGEYFYRISALNKFHKPSNWSNWEILSDNKNNLKYTYLLQWKKVKKSNGYIIQIRNQSKQIIREEEVKNNKINIKLPEGQFQYRISALNKFKKPSNWSKWDDIYIEPHKLVARTDKLENLKINTDKQNYGWKLYVPGYPQIKNGDTLKGNLLIAWFAILSAAAYSEWKAGNELASDPLNNPDNLTTLALAGSPELSLYFREQREQAQSEYNTHQQNQAYIAALALLTYSYHIWDAKNSNPVDLSFKIKSTPFQKISHHVFNTPTLEFSVLLKF